MKVLLATLSVVFLATSCNRNVQPTDSDPTGKAEENTSITSTNATSTSEARALDFWRREVTNDNPQACWVDTFIREFGGEVTTPLLLRSLETRHDPDVRAGIIYVASLHCWWDYDTNGHLSAVLVKGLYDTNAIVRETALECLSDIKNHVDEKAGQSPAGDGLKAAPEE